MEQIPMLVLDILVNSSVFDKQHKTYKFANNLVD